jgi:hypothetical protein
MSNYKYSLDENKDLVLTKNNDTTNSDSEGSESIIGEPVDTFTPALEQITEESPSIQQQLPPLQNSDPDPNPDPVPMQIPTIQTPTANSQFTPIDSFSQINPDLQESESEPESIESEPESIESIESEPESESESDQIIVLNNGNDGGDAYDSQNLPDFLDFLGNLDETSSIAQVDAMGKSNFRGTIVQDFPLEWIIYVVSYQKEHNSPIISHLINWMFYMLTRTQINELINPVPGSYIASLMDTFGIKFNYNNNE